MEFQITREALLTPLQVVAPVVETKVTLPIYSNVYVSVSQSELTLLGTDLELELSARCPLMEQLDDFEITMPARKLMDICRALPEGTLLSFKFLDNQVQIRTPKSRFTLPTLPAENFARIEDEPGEQEFVISEAALKKMLQASYFSMAVQDVRYFLNGLFLEVGQTQLATIATDGHRLACSYKQIAEGEYPQAQVLIPRKAIIELLRLLSDDAEAEMTCVMGKTHLRVVTRNFTFTTKLIDANFPDYKRVVPKRTDNHLKVSRLAFKEALSRVALLTNEKFKGVKLQAENNTLLLSAKNRDIGEAEEELTVDIQGDSLLIALNINYLLDILNACDSELISINYADPHTGVIIEAVNDDANLYVVMPMRL